MKSCLLLCISVVAARNSYTIPFGKQSLDQSFSIPTKNVTGSATSQLQDCNIIADQSLLVSCANGWHAVDQVSHFVSAGQTKLTKLDTLKFQKKVKNPRTQNAYTMFGDASSDLYRTLKFIGNQTYLLDKYGSSSADGQAVPKFVDGVMTDEIFAIMLQTQGQKVVQIHKKDKSFTNLASVNSINKQTAETQSMDLIYDEQEDSYDVYVIVKAEGYNQLVEMSFAKVALQEAKPEPSVLVYKSIFEKLPDNCGDKLKATQKLLIVVCTKNGAVNIFQRRADKLMLVNEQASGIESGQDIGVIEFNTNLKKVLAQRLRSSQKETAWMRQFTGTSQTYVFISVKSSESEKAKTLAWEILVNPFRSNEAEKNVVLKYDNFEKHFKPTATNNGEILNVAAGGDDKLISDPSYMITNWFNFDQFQVFGFCGFMQHYDNGICVDNAANSFQVGLPSSGSAPLYKCMDVEKECLKDSESIQCVKLTFICISDGIQMGLVITIVAIIFGLLFFSMIVVYCVLQRRLKRAQIINGQFLSDARQTEITRQKAQAEKEIEVAKSQKRVIVYIQDNLVEYPNNERKVYQDKLEEEDCGICQDRLIVLPEDDTSDEDTKHSKSVRGPPQCEHYFHHECIMKWVIQLVDKLQQPDCPLCRKHFKPSEAPEKKEGDEDEDKVVEGEVVQDQTDRALDADDGTNPLNAMQAQEMADNTLIEQEMQNLSKLEQSRDQTDNQIILDEISRATEQANK